MHMEVVATLATTILFIKWIPGEGTLMPVTDPPKRGRRRRPWGQHHSPPSTFVLTFSGQRPQKAEDFGNHFPHTGRFCPQHKMGRKLVEEGGDEPQCLSAALAVLTALTTETASQNIPQASPPPSPFHLGGTGLYDWRSLRATISRKNWLRSYQQPLTQQHVRRSPRTHQDGDQSVEWSASPLQRLKVQALSKKDIITRWTSERCKPLRRTLSVYRPLIFPHAPSMRFLTRGRTVNSSASGIAQLASQLSDLTAEAGRRTIYAFSAIRVYGESGFRYFSKRVMRSGLVGGLDSAIKNIDVYGQQDEGSRLAHLTDATVQNVVDVVARDGWEHMATTSGVVVHRQYIALGSDGSPIPSSSLETTTGQVGEQAAMTRARARARAIEETLGAAERDMAVTDDEERAPRFACVKATAILSAPPEVVYLLFADNSRVAEYNEHCKEVMDLEILSPDTKITWAASGRMGPFKARDFCTLVHFRTLSDGTLAQVSRPIEHPAALRSNRYVRSEILLAGNFMRAVPGDPSRTEFLMVTHVNPGGAADTRAGAMLVNTLCATSPVCFIRRLDAAAQKLTRELQEASAVDFNRVADSRAPSSMLPPSERAISGGIS